MDGNDGHTRRIPLALLALAVVMALPVATVVLKGLTVMLAWTGLTLAFDPFTALIVSIFLVPRILGSLWAYFRVDGLWGNEVAYMAFFLWFPLIAAGFYVLTSKSLHQPPRGYEWATIKDGMVHQPVFEYVGPQAAAAPRPSQQTQPGQQQPPPHPPHHQQPYQQQPYQQQPPPQQPPPQQPSPQQPSQQQPYPQQPYQQQPYQQQPYQPQPYQQHRPYQQQYPPPGYSQQPYAPPQWAQHMYGQQPWGAPYPPPTVYPQPQPQHAYQAPRPAAWGPGPEWKKVGEKVVQKRDYLVWHNPILLVINAMMLASFILGLILYPFILSLEGVDESALVDIPSDAAFVLFTLIIQDGILIWMVWHQVVRRRVIPLSEMGISRATLGDSAKMARHTAIGIVFGLVFFAIAVAIELGQNAVGFAPPEDAIVVGPEVGNLVGYLTWLVSACLIAPVSEEFFFRGYAFYAFNKKYGLWVALFVSAIGFSAIHGSIYSLLPIFSAGIGLALAYHWTGSLVPPMVAHAVNNFIAVTLMYLGY
jgi:membrane protease YdiL (CAAX protease family)